MVNGRYKIDWQKCEKNTVKTFYWLWLITAILLICAAIINNHILSDTGERVVFFPDLDRHLLYILYIPVLGLFCQKKNYSWGYIFLGILVYYTYVQLRITMQYM